MIQREERFNRNQAINFAAGKLAKKKPADEVVGMLADAGDMSWEKANEIVQFVVRERKGAIARRRLIGKLLGTIPLILIGFLLIAINGEILYDNGIWPPFYEELVGYQLPIPLFTITLYEGENMIVFGIGLALIGLAIVQALFAFLATLRP